MANTRFFYDDARTIKQLEEMTELGRYMLNVPGNGPTPYYVDDPHIRLQKWGANLYTQHTDIESSLLNLDLPLNRDDPNINKYMSVQPKSSSWIPSCFSTAPQPMQFPSTHALGADQSRASHPAWWYRNTPTLPIDTAILHSNPQQHACRNFSNLLSARMIAKDSHAQ